MNIVISIIIPAYGHPNTLERCLTHIGRQDYPHNLIEVVIVDDCPPLSLTEVANKFQADYTDFHKVTYLKNPTNSGRAITRNRGVNAATGNVCLFLDIDNLLESDCCRNLAQYYHAQPENLAVRCNIRSSEESKLNSSYVRFFNSRYLGQRSPEELQHINFESLPSKFFATDAVAVSINAVKRVGQFDETFSEYGCEDEDLGIRLVNDGVLFKLGIDCHVIDSDTPTIRRACERMTVYAKSSIPKLLIKHPKYSTQTLFSLLEAPASDLNLVSRLKRYVIKMTGIYILGTLVMLLLEKYDEYNISKLSFFYKYSLACYYIKGMRLRSTRI